MPTFNILIVDSDEQSSSLLKEDLQDDGYYVHSLESGSEAYDYVSSHAIDLAILDRNLRDIDSLRLCEKIRTSVTMQHIPIVVISSFDDDEDRSRALKSGATDYLCKPFIYSDLTKAISENLNR